MEAEAWMALAAAFVLGIVVGRLTASKKPAAGDFTQPDRAPSARAAPRNADAGTLSEVRGAILAGKKIEAIKLYRDQTGTSLKDAKEAVDRMEDELR